MNPVDGDPTTGPLDPMLPETTATTPSSYVPPGPEAAPAQGAIPGTMPPDSTAGGPGAWPGWYPDRRSARSARHAERAARREARRGERGLGGAIWGLLLILFGVGLLAAQLLPGFDWDLAWPLAFVAIGMVLAIGSIRRAPLDG